MIRVCTLHVYGGPGRVLPKNPFLLTLPAKIFTGLLSNEVNEAGIFADEVNLKGKASKVKLDFEGEL